MQVVRKGNTIQVGDWTITCNLTEKGKAAIYVSNKTEKVSLNYDAGKKEGATIVTDQVKSKQVNKVLTDYLPDFEIKSLPALDEKTYTPIKTLYLQSNIK